MEANSGRVRKGAGSEGDAILARLAVDSFDAEEVFIEISFGVVEIFAFALEVAVGASVEGGDKGAESV